MGPLLSRFALVFHAPPQAQTADASAEREPGVLCWWTRALCCSRRVLHVNARLEALAALGQLQRQQARAMRRLSALGQVFHDKREPGVRSLGGRVFTLLSSRLSARLSLTGLVPAGAGRPPRRRKNKQHTRKSASPQRGTDRLKARRRREVGRGLAAGCPNTYPLHRHTHSCQDDASFVPRTSEWTFRQHSFPWRVLHDDERNAFFSRRFKRSNADIWGIHDKRLVLVETCFFFAKTKRREQKHAFLRSARWSESCSGLCILARSCATLPSPPA